MQGSKKRQGIQNHNVMERDMSKVSTQHAITVNTGIEVDADKFKDTLIRCEPELSNLWRRLANELSVRVSMVVEPRRE